MTTRAHRATHIWRRLYLTAWLMLVCAPAAHAYIDPGSQTFLLQGVLALLGGLLAFTRSPRASLRALMDRIRKRKDA